ncbi:MAG: MFS transporter [Candidatus Latescibacteria bacterium]|nr:MFS transporter [Candidatus Latescibacterota bacterium]
MINSLFAIQFLANLAPTLVLIYVPLIAQSYGAAPAKVGLVVATYHAMVFAAGLLFGRLADLRGRKNFIVLGLGLSTIAFTSHLLINDITSLFIIRAVAGFSIGIFPAALLTYAYEKNNTLGRFSAIGSLGWGIGSILAGIVAVYYRLFILAGLFYFVTFLLAIFRLQKTPAVVKQTFWDLSVIKKNWRIYLTFLLRHAGAFGIWAIYPIFLASLGANKFWIGIIYSINAFGQFLFLPLLDRYKSTKLITTGLICSIVTFVIFSLCQNHWQILPFQVLLAFAWSCLYLGTLKYLMEHNEERATAVGGFNSLMSLSGIIGPLLGGVIGTFGYRPVMLSAAVLTASSFLVFRSKN